MAISTWADSEESIRTKWDDESSINDLRVQHLSYIFEETGESIPYALFVPSLYKKDENIPDLTQLNSFVKDNFIKKEFTLSAIS